MATAPNLSSLNVVYRPQTAANQNNSIDLELIAWSGKAVSDIENFDVELRPQAAGWHRENLNEIIDLAVNASGGAQ